MDVQQRLDEIVATVDGARSMPMSASCVVNRAELLAMLQEVREALPGSLAQARELLGGRDQMVAEAQQEAQRIIDSAQAERGSLVSGTEIARHSQDEADRILAEARREAADIRAEADEYVDSKLANFEVVLSKTIGSVDRGREKLLGSGRGADQYDEQYAEDAPERTADPAELRHRADAYVDARLGSVSAVLAKTLEAVGRGRQKLLGHDPADDLGAHMEARDAQYAQDEVTAAGRLTQTSDADYMAGLAADVPAQRQLAAQEEEAAQQVAAQQVTPQQVALQQVAAVQAQQPHGILQQPEMPPQPAAADPYYAQQLQAQQDAYYAQQQAQQQQDAYYTQQAQQAYYGQQPQQGYDQQGYDQQAYDQQAYDQQAQQAAQQQQQGYGQQYYQDPQPQQPAAALDETSLFDTSMIDLNQVRQYEERYDQGR